MLDSSRHSEDSPASQGLHLLRQQLLVRVAVAQPAIASTAPAPDGAVGGDGKNVEVPSRHSDDALACQRLDLFRQQLVLLVAVAQLAIASIASAPNGAVTEVMARLWASPTDTATTRWPSKASTFVPTPHLAPTWTRPYSWGHY